MIVDSCDGPFAAIAPRWTLFLIVAYPAEAIASIVSRHFPFCSCVRPFAAIALGIRALSILLAQSHLLPLCRAFSILLAWSHLLPPHAVFSFACMEPFGYSVEPTLLIVVPHAIAPRLNICIVVSPAEAICCHPPRPTL